MKIRAQQMAAFEAEEVLGFERRNLTRLRMYFPEHAGKSDTELLDLIRDAVRQAGAHGINNDYDISLYIGATAELGRGFDRSDSHPWAREILENPHMDAHTKMVCLYMYLEPDGASDV